MLQSIRARLTAWYAGALALFMVVFAVAGYAFVAQATGARIDEALRKTAGDVVRALDAEIARGVPGGVAILRVMRQFRLGDAAVAVLDLRSGAAVVAFETAPAQADGAVRDAPPAPPRFGTVLETAPARPAFTTVSAGDGAASRMRVFTLPYLVDGHTVVIGAAQSLATQQRTLREARTALAIGAPLLLLLAVAGGYALARTSLSPVADMAERAARIGAGTLHERLPVGNPHDELGRLAAVFNELLGRLESAFDRQRRFMADASHELRTPVAIVGGEAELALARDDRSAGELRAALGTIGEEAATMRRMVEDLFLLARADAGEQRLEPTELYLADLAADAARSVRTLAARKGITVTHESQGDLPARGDEALLRRLVLNLLDNAIKYTPVGGRVTVVSERRGEWNVVEVTDTGPGIAPEIQPRIFDRFFRHERAGGGAGLGLSIARWIAQVHGGRLELVRSDATGSTFAVELPAGGAPLPDGAASPAVTVTGGP